MTVFIKILAGLGILLLLILALLLWLILVPRHFWLEYSKPEGPTAKMNVAFFKVTLYPLPKFLTEKADKPDKKKEDKTDKAKTETKEDKKENNPLKNLQLSFNLVQQIISAAKGIMQRVFRAIKFRDVSFTLPIHMDSPERTQQAYGMVTNSFYTLAMFLQKHLQINFKSPIFVADFAGTYGDAVYFYTQVTASPILLLAAGYFAYTQYKEIITTNQKPAPADPQATETVAEKELTNG